MLHVLHVSLFKLYFIYLALKMVSVIVMFGLQEDNSSVLIFDDKVDGFYSSVLIFDDKVDGFYLISKPFNCGFHLLKLGIY